MRVWKKPVFKKAACKSTESRVDMKAFEGYNKKNSVIKMLLSLKEETLNAREER